MIMYTFLLGLISQAEDAISYAYVLFWFYEVHLQP